MVATAIMHASVDRHGGCAATERRRGNHALIAVAPISMDERIPTALTGRQKLALSLAKAGYSHSRIAEMLHIRHRQAASRLIARARAAADALNDAVMEILANQ